MPLFYSTTPPSSSSFNTINSITPTIRDFLLTKNLVPQYPSALSVSPGNQKIGEPVLDTMVGSGSVVIPNGLPLEVEGLYRYDIATLPNTFRDNSSTARSLTSVDDLTQTTYKDFPTINNSNVGAYPDSIDNNGLLVKTKYANYIKNNTLKNIYLDSSKQIDISSFIDYQPANITKQISGYLDTYGGINLGGNGTNGGTKVADVIGSILNGQGLGLSNGGVVTNFDLRSSLAGRVLGATGVINDTKLGMIGGQQLALALANNAAFNTEQSILGAANVQDNILSLVKNGTISAFPRPNYKITVPSSNLGKVGDYVSRILGFTLPKSYLDDSGSIFQSESGQIDNITRANSMLLNTGNGQLTALISNIVNNINGTGIGLDSPDKTYFRSGYAPGYQDHSGVSQINGNQIYAFSKDGHLNGLLDSTGGAIPNLSYSRTALVENSGFVDFSNSGFIGDSYTSSNIRNPTFSWTSDPNSGQVNVNADYRPVIGDKKSLLNKTQILFNSKGMLNIVSVKGASGIIPSQIQTAVFNNMISKGSGVLSSNNFDDNGKINITTGGTPDNTFCRSWTTFNRYEKVQNLIRNSGINNTVPFRNQINGSILDDNGFPKIAPYITDNPSDPKKFMFSIENLAWNDNVNDLLLGEQGPGDLVTGKKGRIMWFPPYDIEFSENNSVNWETTNFIGRGESVYSYNNTERSGTLSFKIVVDHSTYTNSFRGTNGPDDQYVNSFMAGCVDPNSSFAQKLTVSEISSLSTNLSVVQQKKNITPQTPPSSFDIFFPNDVYDVPVPNGYNGKGYEDGINITGAGPINGEVTQPLQIYNDTTNFGLNKTYFSDLYLTNFTVLNNYLINNCPACSVTVTGYASPQGNNKANLTLATKRANNVITFLKTKLFTNLKPADLTLHFKAPIALPITGGGCKANSDPSTLDCKDDRKVTVRFEFNSNLLPKNEISGEPVLPSQTQQLNNKILNRFYNESNYFEKLTQEDYFIFDKFREKIRYFHPAFHSTTPEGLNSRLTFLNQCTRQGPTLEEEGATNLAFGRPPVCILRIGDFYNTKIIIDSLGIDYEPLVWDLNPEGIGVQPMIANVKISFKFIGGSTLMGPINKLQNALSFNYYANTQVYDVRADYIARDPNKDTTKNVNGANVDVFGYSLINGVTDLNNTVSSNISDLTKPPTINQTLSNDNSIA